MTSFFGRLEDGSQARLYTLTGFGLTAQVTDFGATLVRLLVPDAGGTAADVVLGYDQVSGYARGTGYLGATVGRNANRIAGAAFLLDGTEVRLAANEGPNSLHSGPEGYSFRLWQVETQTESSVTFRLQSPHGDQGFPGNATVWVTYALEPPRALRITYRGECDRNTVFNLTNHSYFNLAGQDRPELAMDQKLTLTAPAFHPADEASIPTGEERRVEGTPMGFRTPKVLGAVLKEDYPPLHLQSGVDHNFVLNGSAVLEDPHSGRRMTLTPDCPGLQVYTANFLQDTGKGGIFYPPHSGVALEPQFYPDFVHHPHWPQSIGKTYRSQALYSFA